MSVHDITLKQKDAAVKKGTGFYIDGFGHVELVWTQDEDFDANYDQMLVLKATFSAVERLFSAIYMETGH